MATLQASPSLSMTEPKPPTFSTNTAAEAGLPTDMLLVAQLLDFGQLFCQKMPGTITGLCREVERITQGRAHLHIGCANPPTYHHLPAHTLTAIPVQFGFVSYGVLCITGDPLHTELPSIQIPIAQIFAQACSWLLHTLEQSIFLRGQCRQFEYQVQGSLTKREQEVLQLIYQGYSQEEIADQLSIAPATLRKHRQHIYEQLGVHNERDALLVAYQSRLLPPFGKPAP